jgi:hypothetical protein
LAGIIARQSVVTINPGSSPSPNAGFGVALAVGIAVGVGVEVASTKAGPELPPQALNPTQASTKAANNSRFI